MKFFVLTTRPAAIELLVQRFEKPELMAKQRQRLRQLLLLSGRACTAHIRQVTPLRRLQDRTVGIME